MRMFKEKTTTGIRSLLSVVAYIKKEPVLMIAALTSVLTMIFVPPDERYLEYIDLRVIGLLFCLMSVVAGLVKTGLFTLLSAQLTSKVKNVRSLALILTLLSFFMAMLVTNDVALIMLVPLTLGLMSKDKSDSGKKSMLITVVLETVGANLGSMATPVGNPQNIFLYSNYKMSAAEFFSAVLPVAGISILILCVVCILCVKSIPLSESYGEVKQRISDRRLLTVSAVLFGIAILSVFRVVDWRVCTAVSAAAYLIFDREIFRRVDWCLLLTFVCFFVFSGNLGRIQAVKNVLIQALSVNETVVSAAASQIISNVPAAVMLSGFTDNARGLLIGTNVGGLGTPVASLASLISLRFYFASPGAERGKYIAVFSMLNFSLLAVLLTFSVLVL